MQRIFFLKQQITFVLQQQDLCCNRANNQYLSKILILFNRTLWKRIVKYEYCHTIHRNVSNNILLKRTINLHYSDIESTGKRALRDKLAPISKTNLFL